MSPTKHNGIIITIINSKNPAKMTYVNRKRYDFMPSSSKSGSQTEKQDVNFIGFYPPPQGKGGRSVYEFSGEGHKAAGPAGQGKQHGEKTSLTGTTRLPKGKRNQGRAPSNLHTQKLKGMKKIHFLTEVILCDNGSHIQSAEL